MNEIIIDGVNVAECNKYDSNSYIECLNDQTTSRKCNGNPDCDFKQLQRLKKENEQLKKQINDAEKYIDELQDALRDMEIQKDNIKNLKPIDITEFCNTAERVLDNSNKYKTALEKVKKECKKPLNEKFLINDFLNAKDEELTEVGIMQRNILKIIDEVLNNVENR